MLMIPKEWFKVIKQLSVKSFNDWAESIVEITFGNKNKLAIISFTMFE